MSSLPIRAWWILLCTQLRLRRWRGERLAELLRAPASGASAAQHGLAQRLAVEINRASHGVPRTRCFVRAVALVRLLHRARIPARLLLGVRRDGNAVRAHAWVEIDGRPLGEDLAALHGFEPLPDPGPTMNWDR